MSMCEGSTLRTAYGAEPVVHDVAPSYQTRGEVSRLILVGVADGGRADADPPGTRSWTSSASEEAAVGSNVPLGINSVSAGAAGPRG